MNYKINYKIIIYKDCVFCGFSSLILYIPDTSIRLLLALMKWTAKFTKCWNPKMDLDTEKTREMHNLYTESMEASRILNYNMYHIEV